MKTDLYTKCILTVIAIALLWQCVQNTAAPKVVFAQQPPFPSRVVISGYEIGAPEISGRAKPLDDRGLPVAVLFPLEGHQSNAAIRTSAKPQPK